MNKKKNALPTKHKDGRWMYDDKKIEEIFKRMSNKRQLKVLTKAIKIMEENNRSMLYSIAKVLRIHYDDAGFWYSKKQVHC